MGVVDLKPRRNPLARGRIMSVAIAEGVWMAVGAYFAIGLVVALVLVLGAIKRIDRLAAAAPWRVKGLLVPGLAALWPLVLTLAYLRRSRGAT